MDELASANMLGFRDYLRSEDYAERTVYNYLMTVTTFLKKNGVYRIVGLLEAEDWPEIPCTTRNPTSLLSSPFVRIVSPFIAISIAFS